MMKKISINRINNNINKENNKLKEENKYQRRKMY